MTQPEVLDLFRASGALLEGHFKLSSGLHSPAYLQCALVLQHPAHAEALGKALGAAIARSWRGGLQPASSGPASSGPAEAGPSVDGQQAKPITAVLSPALGGLIIGHEVARALGVRAIFAERQEGTLTLRRGFSLSPGDRVVVIEDVVTTGGSTRETIAVAAQAGATVVAAGAIIDRSGGTSSLGVAFSALATLAVETWPPDACPLCRAGRPITKPGSRA